MTPIAIAGLAFASTFGSALATALVKSWLPPAHLRKESQESSGSASDWWRR